MSALLAQHAGVCAGSLNLSKNPPSTAADRIQPSGSCFSDSGFLFCCFVFLLFFFSFFLLVSCLLFLFSLFSFLSVFSFPCLLVPSCAGRKELTAPHCTAPHATAYTHTSQFSTISGAERHGQTQHGIAPTCCLLWAAALYSIHRPIETRARASARSGSTPKRPADPTILHFARHFSSNLFPFATEPAHSQPRPP